MRCSFIRRPPRPKQKCIRVCTVGGEAKLISQTWVDLGLVIGWRKSKENCRNRRQRLGTIESVASLDLREQKRQKRQPQSKTCRNCCIAAKRHGLRLSF